MSPATILETLLMNAAAEPVVLVLLIVAGTFVLEDLATITVALLAHRMVIDGTVALGAALIGTIAGDLALYAAARWLGESRFVRRWTERPGVAATREWLRARALPMVVVARFTPGFRLPVYAGAGTIGLGVTPFTVAVVLSALVWTPGLYAAATHLDAIGIARLGAAGWVAAAILGLGLLVLPRATSRALARARGGKG